MNTFKEAVLEIVASIPPGKVVSYGQVALMAGIPRAAQAVGQILADHGNKVPWWRVINNQGYLSIRNIKVEDSKNLQKKLLEKEDVIVSNEFILDIEKYRWRPNEKDLKMFELNEELIENFIRKYVF